MPMLTVPQVAARLGISYQRAWQLIDRGQLPAVKPGRDWLVDEADLALVGERPPPGRPARKGPEPA